MEPLKPSMAEIAPEKAPLMAVFTESKPAAMLDGPIACRTFATPLVTAFCMLLMAVSSPPVAACAWLEKLSKPSPPCSSRTVIWSSMSFMDTLPDLSAL